jgi:tRNA (cmo5U34)-methyltransferase
MAKFTFAQREEGFDNHIEQSIRGYSNLMQDVLKISEYFVEDYSDVIDIGCSTGKMLKAMIKQNSFAPRANYVGIEIEEDFYPDYDNDEKEIGQLHFYKGDVRSFPFEEHSCSLITSIFTLQFMPEDQRQDVIKSIYRGLKKGGAFVFSEKTIAENPKIQEIRTFTYYDYKRQFFTSDDILDKEKKLRHMMKLNTRNELVRMCATAGFEFQSIDTFWQNYAFTGFIAIKT